VRRSFNGVEFPTLASRHKLEQEVEQIKVDTGLEPFNNGLGVKVDLRELLKINVLESVRVGLFYIDATGQVKQQHGEDPEVQLVLDSAWQHKGMKVTSAGFVFPHGSHHPMAPSNTHEHAHIEGDDGNEDMATLGAEILAGMHTNHSLPHKPPLSL
jgi:hypothetical protein